MKFLDTLRGLYIKSPNWLRQGVSPALAILPINIKYGKTYTNLYKDIACSRNDAEFVREYQVANLRNIAKLAAKTPYYKKIFVENSINPDAFTLADLQKLPILDKNAIRQNSEAFLTKDISQCDVSSTSGTSGQPLKFYMDKDRGVKEWAFVNTLWATAGYTPNDLRAVLRGVKLANPDDKPYDYNPALRELRLSPFHLHPETMDKYLQLITQYKVKFIHGYPSAIDILARHAHKTNWQKSPYLQGVLAVSENLLQHQRCNIENAFGKVFPFYGMSEKVAIAGEIAKDIYEFEPLYGYTELVDEQNNPVTEVGQQGRIIGTGFISTAMSLIRYDTGDYAELLALPTYENGYRLRLRNIQSRWGQEFVVDKHGGLISIAAINIHSSVYAKIREFQIYQDVVGEAIVKIIPTPNVKKDELQPFIDEIQKKVGTGIAFKLEIVSEIAKNTRGKRKFISQQLNLQDFQ